MVKLKLKGATVALFLAIAIPATFSVLGQGCSGMQSSSSESGPSGALNNGGGGDVCTASGKVVDKNYVVEPERRTVAILYGHQILDSFVACTGVGLPSLRTTQVYEDRLPSFSEYGALVDVSAALLMSVAATSAEVCRDVLDREKALPINSLDRVLFRSVNLSSNGLTSSEATSILNMIAYSCWQKIPTAAETTLVQATASELGRLGASSEASALGLCTALLGSLASIQL